VSAEALSGVDFGSVDVESLERYDAAVKADKEGSSVSVGERLALWRGLSKAKGELGELARGRARELEAFERGRQAALARLRGIAEEDARVERARRAQMEKDWGKLSRLLPLEVVSRRDKLRWVEAFLESYGAVEGLNPYVGDQRVVGVLGELGAKVERLRAEGAREVERRARRAEEVAGRRCELEPETRECAERREAAERAERAERERRERAERAERAERERRDVLERAERERRDVLERAERIGVRWVRIPEGSFRMGSASGGEDDERPVRTVTVRSFEMSRTEVTVGQYRKCVEAGVCSEPSSCSWGSPNWSSSSGSKENHPINCVDWGQARTFAKWVGADLPTEAEWEYAARGGQDFIYAGSNSPDDVAWYASNSGGGTQPVGTKRANGYGLHDMSGNVWEWTLDEYKSDYNGAPSDGHQAVGSIPTCSTKCDNGAARRVFRGGCWFYDASHLRVALRYCISPVPRNGNLGLRLRRTLP